MTLLPLLLACDLAVTTEETDGHAHQFSIPREDLRDPPGDGLVLETTETGGHSHGVPVSVTSLKLLGERGGIGVTGLTDESEGHEHEWHAD